MNGYHCVILFRRCSFCKTTRTRGGGGHSLTWAKLALTLIKYNTNYLNNLVDLVFFKKIFKYLLHILILNVEPILLFLVFRKRFEINSYLFQCEIKPPLRLHLTPLHKLNLHYLNRYHHAKFYKLDSFLCQPPPNYREPTLIKLNLHYLWILPYNFQLLWSNGF